ncbi:lymphocyte antigen 6E [Meriones unguiculatus]|uniref:lymphocyte antigen 6E n=1 Tax=Meriones unguiculatus TaxID=10047 RepID=UPI000B4FB642|nr:lymphocyte antigen 6E [Meriones unguiculatus]XP_021515558.1 lymphocyte antigen 6E [Meriones unguiculatus]XP_021515567.1 lymphocyte antigen 6E [Meriones unguiculatus]
MSVASSMRVFLPVLLAVLLGVEQAHSLICFSCNNQKSNWKCLWPTSCESTDNYCVTVSAAAGIGNLDLGYTLSKGCAPICPKENVNINLGVASMSTYCCGHSFCNISTAGLGLRASIPLLGLGILLSLLTLLQLDP